MAAPQNFRNAFNGFNREDVVRYLEYLNAKHAAQVNQLVADADFLRNKVEQLQADHPDADAVSVPTGDLEALQEQLEEARVARESLETRCAELQERCDGLEKKLAESQTEAVVFAPAEPAEEDFSPKAELAAYRRAERAERVANERAGVIYNRTSGILADATAKVENMSEEIGSKAEGILAELQALQNAIREGRQSLVDAASIMDALRPDQVAVEEN